MSASLFPNGIWNGITDARPDLAVVKPPTHNDWRLMLHELEAIQRYVLNLADNIDKMPNINEEIKDATAKVEKMQATLERVSPPWQLEGAVRGIRERLDTLLESHSKVKRGVKRLLLRTRTVEDLYKKLEEEVAQQFEVIRNQVRNQLASHSKETKARVEALQKQIEELHDALTDTDI